MLQKLSNNYFDLQRDYKKLVVKQIALTYTLSCREVLS